MSLAFVLEQMVDVVDKLLRPTKTHHLNLRFGGAHYNAFFLTGRCSLYNCKQALHVNLIFEENKKLKLSQASAKLIAYNNGSRE